MTCEIKKLFGNQGRVSVPRKLFSLKLRDTDRKILSTYLADLRFDVLLCKGTMGHFVMEV